MTLWLVPEEPVSNTMVVIIVYCYYKLGKKITFHQGDVLTHLPVSGKHSTNRRSINSQPVKHIYNPNSHPVMLETSYAFISKHVLGKQLQIFYSSSNGNVAAYILNLSLFSTHMYNLEYRIGFKPRGWTLPLHQRVLCFP